jgi:hypothetical protein
VTALGGSIDQIKSIFQTIPWPLVLALASRLEKESDQKLAEKKDQNWLWRHEQKLEMNQFLK